MATEAASLFISLKADIRDAERKLGLIKRELGETEKTAGATGVSFGRLSGIAGQLGLGLSAIGAAKIALEMAELNTSAEAAERSLIAMSGSALQAEANTLALRRAVNFSISEMDAQRIAASLLSRELAKNSQDLGNFAADAALVGKAFGGFDAARSIQEVSSAISNFSVERLDTLGISSTAVRQRMDELQATTEGLSREQAFGIAVMEQLAVSAEKLRAAGVEAGSGMETLKTALHDAAVEASSVFGPAIDTAADAVGRFLSEGVDRAQSQRHEVEMLRATADELERLGNVADATALRRSAQALELGPRAGRPEDIRARTKAILESADGERAYAQALEVSRGRLEAVNPELLTHSQFVRRAGEAAGPSREQITALNEVIAGIGPAAFGSEGALSALREEIEATGAAATEAGQRALAALGVLTRLRGERPELFDPALNQATPTELRGVATGFGFRRLIEDVNAANKVVTTSNRRALDEWYQDYNQTLKQVSTATSKTADDTKKAFERAFNDIKGVAESSLTSLSDQVNERDFLLDQFGLRRQGPSEIMRQLEDIFVNAERSPFVGKFKELAGKVGDELRAGAEFLKRELQAGRRLDLIPDSLVLADVEAQLMARRELEAKADQIAQQLIAKGFTEQEVGFTLSEEFGVTMDATGAGMVSTVTDGIRTAVTNQAEEIKAQGKAYGMTFEEGLLGHLTGVGSRFIQEVTAQVIGQITAGSQGSAG